MGELFFLGALTRDEPSCFIHIQYRHPDVTGIVIYINEQPESEVLIEVEECKNANKMGPFRPYIPLESV